MLYKCLSFFYSANTDWSTLFSKLYNRKCSCHLFLFEFFLPVLLFTIINECLPNYTDDNWELTMDRSTSKWIKYCINTALFPHNQMLEFYLPTQKLIFQNSTYTELFDDFIIFKQQCQLGHVAKATGSVRQTFRKIIHVDGTKQFFWHQMFSSTCPPQWRVTWWYSFWFCCKSNTNYCSDITTGSKLLQDQYTYPQWYR